MAYALTKEEVITKVVNRTDDYREDLNCPTKIMINETFQQFKKIISQRCDKYKLVSFGEDSIRYDFVCAISNVFQLEPWEIQLEFPLHVNSFIPLQNEKSKRKERPLLDLVIDNKDISINVEFALFRQNSNENGTINKTYRTVKMMNDMVRLAMDSICTKRKSYFICVADDKMLGHQLRSKLLGEFPDDYKIAPDMIKKQKLVVLIKGFVLNFST